MPFQRATTVKISEAVRTIVFAALSTCLKSAIARQAVLERVNRVVRLPCELLPVRIDHRRDSARALSLNRTRELSNARFQSVIATCWRAVEEARERL